MALRNSLSVLNEISEELRHGKVVSPSKLSNDDSPHKTYNIYVNTHDSASKTLRDSYEKPERLTSVAESSDFQTNAAAGPGASTLLTNSSIDNLRYSTQKKITFSPDKSVVGRRLNTSTISANTSQSEEMAKSIKRNLERTMKNFDHACEDLQRKIKDLIDEEPISIEYIKSKYMA
mmetsp:Transcript_25150/g.28756  ORF Transcript_25150/g.28756 Transcript_25150/m.28756 type:complete len:176 (+) Transcript_25150:133-660(+)|eukprot:CAMPEP_0115026380 /NCGR_PEP_ID=MMETSP0216-20121206/34703_1 /TAXON_ID=223996 /ORGANISM="Protocruzia adherens, Strain Boccale" /LENGTH=175 /DNA_ID=CAMNT_0002401427 /DNA_START=107 /DNA_END=634 /DNA_ORIENTATION=+